MVQSRAGPARQPGWALGQPPSIPTPIQAARVPLASLQRLCTSLWHRNLINPYSDSVLLLPLFHALPAKLGLSLVVQLKFLFQSLFSTVWREASSEKWGAIGATSVESEGTSALLRNWQA